MPGNPFTDPNWAPDLANTVERVVGKVRNVATDNAVKASRGVVFGKGSQIDAGGFLASTLGLSDTQFMAGQYSLAAGPETPGALQADGRISAPGGTVALVAPQL